MIRRASPPLLPLFGFALLLTLSGCPLGDDGNCDPTVEVCDCDGDDCVACEEGGDCRFSGSVTVLGSATETNNDIIDDLEITARCGNRSETVQPDEQGDYRVSIDVNNCETLTVTFLKETYVPATHNFRMPPAVSHLQLDVELQRAGEVLCGNTLCQEEAGTSGDYTGYAHDDYDSAWHYSSDRLDGMELVGSSYESTDGDLLWLHRFTFMDYRDDNGDPIDTLPSIPEVPNGRRVGTEVDDQQLDWIGDLYNSDTWTEYRVLANYDDYAEAEDQGERDDAEDDFNACINAYTEADIDEDDDGFYDGIEMNAYKLDVETGLWEELDDRAYIAAQIERIYDDVSSALDVTVACPSYYLASIRADTPFGPSAEEEANGTLGTCRSALMRNPLSVIPVKSSGVFAIGQTIPRSCIRFEVTDECGTAMAGAQVVVSGQDHGFRYRDVADQDGVACVEVGRSEGSGNDYDSDNQNGEEFFVSAEVSAPVGSDARDQTTDAIQTPKSAGSCENPSSCAVETIELPNSRCD